MTAYRLLVSFRSNAHPWTGSHHPYPKDRFGDDDEAAKEWARYFQDTLPEYMVTLLKDETPLPIEP
jgi:hypothetical protein